MSKITPLVVKKRAPITPNVDITLPPPTVGGLVDPVEYPGLISREDADKPFLDIEVPIWIPLATDPRTPDRLDLHLDDVGDFETGFVGTETFVAPQPPFVTVRLPRRLLTEGEHHVSYKVTSQRGTNEAGSPEVPLVVDRTAPYDSVTYFPRALTLPADWPGRVSEDYLNTHPGGVEFGIPPYVVEGADPGDTYQLFYSTNSIVPIAEGPVFPGLVVIYTRALAQASDGEKVLQYRLVDVAGNVSKISHQLPIIVQLRPAPVLLPAGIVDAVSLAGFGDRLFDRPDAARSVGMTVLIPGYDIDRAADLFVVRLTTLHGTEDVGPIPLGGSRIPFDFHVGFPTLRALYGTSTGRIDLSVEYSVLRHGTEHRVPTPTVIEFDLDVGGPENDNEPDPVNNNLLPPNLEGPTSGLPEELTAADRGLDAPVIVTLWSAAPLPSARPFEIWLYYMNELVDTVTVDNTTALPGDEIPMTVPWPYIQKHSNGTIPLHYEIVVPTTSNRTFSPPQPITVNANSIAFLAPRVIGALPEIPGTPPIPGLIGCSAAPAPARQVQVFVPPHDSFTEGMRVTVNWTGCSDDDGRVPIALATGRFDSAPLTLEMIRVGFNVAVGPYATYLKPINQANHSAGSVLISYSVPVIGPSPIDSAEIVYEVRGVVAGPAYCDGTPWP